LEILILVGILVFLFGAKKIPELARGMGIGIKEFKQGLREAEAEDEAEVQGSTQKEPEADS
jgi:sec-independent protein translocase protein TatA